MITKIKKNKRGNQYKNIFFSILIILALLLSISFLIVNNIKVNKKRAELSAQINNLKFKIKQAQEHKRELESRISQSESKENIEEVARDQLGLKKPGEEVIAVKRPKKETNINKKENKSWWEIIKDILNH